MEKGLKLNLVKPFPRAPITPSEFQDSEEVDFSKLHLEPKPVVEFSLGDNILKDIAVLEMKYDARLPACVNF